MIRKKSAAAMAMAAMLLLAACGGGREKTEPASDTPWNNGLYAIMETDTGYYSNWSDRQCLRYYEKESGTEIYLCTKPECQHNGADSCTATYHSPDLKSVNTVLYEDKLYILATEENDRVVSFNLYRASLDGSSLDKVGEVFSAENTSDAEVYLQAKAPSKGAFIIHKGYAYIPFFMSFNWSMKGFVNGGIMKMDLSTGKTEQIYQMERLTAGYPTKVWGCGNYVFFDVYGNMAGKKDRGTFLYDTRDGSVKYITDVLFPDQDMEGNMWISAATEDGKVYDWGFESMGDDKFYGGIIAYDMEKAEYLGVVVQTDESIEGWPDLILYEDTFLVCADDTVWLYSVEGEYLGKIGYDFPGIKEKSIYQGTKLAINSDKLMLKVSQGKLYAICYYRPSYDLEGYQVFSCPLEDIAAGKGRWSLAYTIKAPWAIDKWQEE